MIEPSTDKAAVATGAAAELVAKDGRYVSEDAISAASNHGTIEFVVDEFSLVCGEFVVAVLCKCRMILIRNPDIGVFSDRSQSGGNGNEDGVSIFILVIHPEILVRTY
ncbi:MAG: hypothetical protein AB7T74_14385 [Clostridia bacterium]